MFTLETDIRRQESHFTALQALRKDAGLVSDKKLTSPEGKEFWALNVCMAAIGKQNVSSMERRAPHKSMHCKFCKPPGVVTPEKITRPQLETNTKVHLAHEAADLRLTNVHDEPGFPFVEKEACVCILEGENSCPKCVPDKSRPPPKKKVCRCPKGAKPHPSMYNWIEPKKKKRVEEDDEFWWEKYSREHDAIAKETWAAYTAQRRQEKKLQKCQSEAEKILLKEQLTNSPEWFQKLSCQQMIYVEFLSTAIRLDSDENVTDRTLFVLVGLGLYPRPKRKILKKCLRYCHYNAIQFLDQLLALIKDDDPFGERAGSKRLRDSLYIASWNERLIMNSICHLEFPALLRELMDRLPPLPKKKPLPPIPYPVIPRLPKTTYESPYEEPLWEDRLHWIEKMKIDRLNRCRVHLDTKRARIPSLALVRRPSLIDARPPFLSQIEANERACRRLDKGAKAKKRARKNPVSTFNSAVDVTAIAEIEASETSVTDKPDEEDICVFFREQKKSEMMEEEVDEEEEENFPDKEVKFLGDSFKQEESQVNCLKQLSDFGEYSEEEAEDIPFRTPAKTESGQTIESPCHPPETTPGPPAPHYEKAKRELDILNKEMCTFFPLVSSSTRTVQPDSKENENEIEKKLKTAARKLKNLADAAEKNTTTKKKAKKLKKQMKSKGKKKLTNLQAGLRACQPEKNNSSKKEKKETKKEIKEEKGETDENEMNEDEEEEGENKAEEEEEEENEEIVKMEEKDDKIEIKYKIKAESQREKDSLASDTDEDIADDWSLRLPCKPIPDNAEPVEKPIEKKKSKAKRRRGEKGGGKKKRRKKRKAKGKPVPKEEEKGPTTRVVSTDYGPTGFEEEMEKEKEEVSFKGDVNALVVEILKDLAEEGFYCASYNKVEKHPDITQLIAYLKGEIINKKKKKWLHNLTLLLWTKMKSQKKIKIPRLDLSRDTILKADWNDKKWISRLAKKKAEQFYFRTANSRALFAIDLYKTLHQHYFGTERFLKIFSAYMTFKYKDAVLRGIF